MIVRAIRADDLSAVKALHEGSGYEHSCPPDDTLMTGMVLEQDGNILGWAGYEICLQAFFLTDTKNLTPRMRLEIMKVLQFAVTEKATEDVPGWKSAFVWVDMNWKRTAKRLVNMGWRKPAGELLEMTRETASRILKELKELV